MSGKNDAMSRTDETPCAANAAPQLTLLHWHNQNPPCPNRTGAILSEQLAAAEQMDVLTGYFYFNGIPELYAALKAKKDAGKPFTLRILVGMEAQIGANDFAHALVEQEPPPNQSPEERKKRYFDNLMTALMNVPSKDKANADAGLYNLILPAIQKIMARSEHAFLVLIAHRGLLLLSCAVHSLLDDLHHMEMIKTQFGVGHEV